MRVKVHTVPWFPAVEVYGPIPGAALRLLFDVVVVAVQIAFHPDNRVASGGFVTNEAVAERLGIPLDVAHNCLSLAMQLGFELTPLRKPEGPPS